jgi:hypothetical protein
MLDGIANGSNPVRELHRDRRLEWVGLCFGWGGGK